MSNVKMNEARLNKGNVDMGIPQESVLRPLIFPILLPIYHYINAYCIILYAYYDVSVAFYVNYFEKLSKKLNFLYNNFL